MTHLYYGDPNKEFSDKLADTLLTSGSDILEIGIPYTDPVCDGDIFQRACQRALQNGTTPLNVFEGIKRLQSKAPIYLTSYYAPIFKIGIERFIKKAKDVGVTGLIIPDILLEEQDDLQKTCRKYELSLIQFATVYSSKDRLKQIIENSTDFIYCISMPGVTGDKGVGKERLLKLIKLLKSLTLKPIYVGFGIISSHEVGEIISFGADGVIVGSAIARIYEKNIFSPEKSLTELSAFINRLKNSTIRKEEKYD